MERRLLRTLIYFICFACLSIQMAWAQNCTLNAGISGEVCPGQPFLLKGKTNGMTKMNGAISGVWTQVSGPAVTISSPIITVNPDGSRNVQAEVSGYAPGVTYRFRLSSECVDGSLIYQEVVYTTKSANMAKAGNSIEVCPGTSAPLTANAPGAGESGMWSIIGPSNGIVINNATAHNTTLTVPGNASGVTTLRWTISNNNGCASYDDITVSNAGGVAMVNAGPDISRDACYDLTSSVQLNASFGGSNIRGQQGTWELISGPSNVSFDDIHVNNTTVRGLVEGVYTLRWSVKGPCVNGSDIMTITVAGAFKGMTTARNVVQTFCDNRTSAILSGPVPRNTGETVAWTRVSGVGVIADPNSPTTAVSGLAPGSSSVFRYTITNGTCVSNGNYTINYVTPPTIALAAPATNPMVLTCEASEVQIPINVSGGDQTQWMLVRAPADAALIGIAGTGYHNFDGSVLTLGGLNKIGTYVIRLRRTTNDGEGGCDDAFIDVTVYVSKTPTPANGGTEQLLACNITETFLAGNDITVGSGKWSIVSQPPASPAVVFDNLTNPTTKISNLSNGAYVFRWIISGNEGCENAQSDVKVKVALTTPTQSNAGGNLTVCSATPIKLNGNLPALNEVGTWTSVPAIAFSDIHDPKAVTAGLEPNTIYNFTWTITNACGATKHTVQYTTSNDAGPKQAVASIDGDLCLLSGTSVNLTGNAPGLNEIGTWTQIGTTPAVVNCQRFATRINGSMRKGIWNYT